MQPPLPSPLLLTGGEGTASVDIKNDRLVVAGPVSFANVMEICARSFQLLPQLGKIWQFELGQLISTDSSGLALLLEWIKVGNEHAQSIKFHNIPASILSLAQVAGVDEILAN